MSVEDCCTDCGREDGRFGDLARWLRIHFAASDLIVTLIAGMMQGPIASMFMDLWLGFRLVCTFVASIQGSFWCCKGSIFPALFSIVETGFPPHCSCTLFHCWNWVSSALPPAFFSIVETGFPPHCLLHSFPLLKLGFLHIAPAFFSIVEIGFPPHCSCLLSPILLLLSVPLLFLGVWGFDALFPRNPSALVLRNLQCAILLR